MTTRIPSIVPTANPPDVLAAIKSASRETGTDFDYLLATAQRESNLDSKAKSKSSSASGLFQFIDQTWLSLVKRYGGNHGLGRFADAISQTESGRYVVPSTQTKSAILALREDAEISALMAGEASKATKQSLECTLGRPVCAGELYAAHFFGEAGARRLIGQNAQNPNVRADMAFPDAAKANRNVFYHADGRAKTIGEVHAWAVGEPANAPATTQPSTMIAAARQPQPARVMASAEPRLGPREDVQDAAGITIRGTRFVYTGAGERAPADIAALPRSPLALSAGVLEILAAFATPSLMRRQG